MNKPNQSDVTTWLKELLESNIRVDKASERCSLLDVIKHHKKTPYPSNELQRILNKNPELEEKIVYHQFDGRRQNETPTIALADLPFLYQIFYDKLRLPKRPSCKPKPPLLAVVAAQQAASENDAPYGWRWDAADQLMRPIHAEQQAIRYLRQLRAFGTRYTEIAAQLSRDQILTRSRAPWTASQVEEVIRFEHEALLQAHEEFTRRVKALFHAG